MGALRLPILKHPHQGSNHQMGNMKWTGYAAPCGAIRSERGEQPAIRPLNAHQTPMLEELQVISAPIAVILTVGNKEGNVVHAIFWKFDMTLGQM